MAPTPGGGLPVARFALLSIAAGGTGLQDAVLVVFLLETLMKFGATRFLAFVPIALGGFLSIIVAPVTNVIGSWSVRLRQRVTFVCLYLAAASTIALAFTLGRTTEKSTRRVWTGIVFASLYRLFSQAAPIVPMLHDAARIHGDDAEYLRRQAIATACIYVSYRVGFFTLAVVVAIMPSRNLNDIFFIILSAALVAIILVSTSVFAGPHESDADDPTSASAAPTSAVPTTAARVDPFTGAPDPFSTFPNANLPTMHTIEDPLPPPPMMDTRPPFRSSVREHLDTSLLKADRHLIASYFETLLYGLAFGQVGSVMASFFNGEVFKEQPGDPDGLKWAAFSTILSNTINVVLDSLLPIVVFRRGARRLNMTGVWVGGALVGVGLFIALKWVRLQLTAMVLFGALAVNTSTHNLFSLLAAAAYVEPKYRGTAFGIRAACTSIGIVVGAIIGGIVSEATTGFDWIMIQAAAATFFSAIAASLGGNVEQMDVAGAAVNANPLISYLLQ